MKKEFWIFVDGGAKPLPDKTFHGSYGYIITEAAIEGELTEIKRGGNYFRQTTAPRMELMSVAHALTYINSYIGNDDEINGGEIYIVADSKNTVMTLTKWIFNWIKNMKDNILYRKDKTKKLAPVLNQDVVVTAFNLAGALSKRFTIKFLHINSHIKPDEMEETYMKFQDFNNMAIGKRDFSLLVKMNEEVDKLVNEIHERGIEVYEQSKRNI